MTNAGERPGRIGQFTVEQELGRGGMGVVYLATQTGLNRKVALKVLEPRLAGDAEFVARFAREAMVLASLDSAHVITIYDHGRSGDYLYLAMQYVNGGDLHAYVARRGPLPTAAALDILGQVVEALGDAHARGVVHRDIKPSNILLRGDRAEPYVYLCDFGIAQDLADPGMTRIGFVAGSLAYMPPERHGGAPASVQSDLYSAGCVLWVMLTGQTPYAGTEVEMAVAHLNSPVPQLSGMGEDVTVLNRLLAWTLAKTPADRPGSAAELLAAIREAKNVPADYRTLLRAAPPEAAVPPPPPAPTEPLVGAATLLRPAVPAPPAPAPEPRRRRWLPAVLSAAVVAAVALVVAFVVWPRDALSYGAGPTAGSSEPAASATPDPPSSEPTEEPTPEEPPTVEPVRFTCWDGSTADTLGECGKPTAVASYSASKPSVALGYLYPGFIERHDAGECDYEVPDTARETWTCVSSDGSTLVRYGYWEDPAEPRKHYRAKFRKGGVYGQPQGYDLYVGNELAGQAWESSKPNEKTGRYVLSAVWLNWQYTVTVESTRRSELADLFDEVSFRELSQVKGHPENEAPAAARGRLEPR